MKKPYYFLLVSFVLSAFVLFSCKKSDNIPQVYPYTLQLKSVVPNYSTRLYINKNLVNNPALLANFTKNNNSLFNLQGTYQTEGLVQTLTFIAKDTAVFDNNFLAKYIVKSSGGQYLFTSVLGFTSTTNNFFDLNKYTSYSSYDMGTGIGYSVFDVRVGYGNYKTLKLSLIAVKASVEANGIYSSLSGVGFNELNENYIKNMGVNDTLVVREYVATYQKM